MSKVKVAKQYIKDLSLKVPNAPEVFSQTVDKPNIDISIDIDAKKISDGAYEITLLVKTSADNGKLFECNLNYAGIFTVEEKEGEDVEKTLLVDCPTLLFPFSRNIITNLVANAGFAPLMIDPIDFEFLYQKRKESVTVN